MACISAPTAILASGALSAGTSLFGASRASSAATDAARVQAQAALAATQLQRDMFGTTQGNLAPFIEAGRSGITALQELTQVGRGANPLTGPITAPISTTFSPTMAQLESTPGYQFVLQQGSKAVRNQMAASGLGGSGPAAVGLTNYAEGLAGTTFQQQFQNWLSQQNLTLAQRQQIYNMVGGIATTGQNAAANLGGLSLQTAGQIGAGLTGAGAATAGGIVGSANALNAGLTNTAGAASNTALLLALNNAGMFGAPGGGTATAGGLVDNPYPNAPIG